MKHVTVNDESRVPDLLQQLNYLKGKRVMIGVFGKKGSDLYLKASVNEFGVDIEVTDKMRAWLHYHGLHLKPSTKKIEIPERSYLRSTFDENLKDIQKKARNGVADVIAGKKKAKDLLDTIGSDLERAVKNKIRNIKNPPNHPFTIKRKSTSAGTGNSPLQDSGDLLKKITFEIR